MLTLAFDLGFGNTKLYGPNGGLVMQSAIAYGHGEAVSRMTGLRTAKRPVCITTEAGTFHVREGQAGAAQRGR